jgi:cytochrome c biogenesis protein CcmG/thiol:disulfide interchange protein DsbE
MKFAVPLGAFLVLSAFLTVGLRLDPREIPSPLVNRPAPPFRLTQLDDPDRTFAPAEMLGRVWLLNVWASWCVSCRAEHALLTALSRTGVVPIYGLAYKDTRENALTFLGSFGNPYVLTMQDMDGRAGIDYGVYGVPESYLIDKTGVIRFKQIGPITIDVLEKTILPMAGRLRR